MACSSPGRLEEARARAHDGPMEQKEAGENKGLVIAVAAAILVIGALAVRRTGQLRESPTYLPLATAAEGKGAVSGHLVREDGAPIEGISMTWMRRLDSLTTMGGGRSEPSGPDGSFRIDDIEPGEGFVEISAFHGSWDGESGLFEVLPGSEASAIVVRAELVDEERVTRGVALDEDGAPVVGATVTARRKRLMSQSMTVVTTTSDGSFEVVTPTAGGEFVLTMERPGHEPATLEGVAVGSQDVELRSGRPSVEPPASDAGRPDGRDE